MIYPPGSRVRIKGERHPKAGQEGTIVKKVSGSVYHVSLEGGIYCAQGKDFVVLELGPEPEPKKRRENELKLFDEAYKRMKLKHSGLREYCKRHEPRNVWFLRGSVK